MEMDTSVAAEKLLAGQKLNYVLMGKTASGWQEQPGSTFMWETILPKVDPSTLTEVEK